MNEVPSSAAAVPPAAIAIERLSVSAGNRELLREASVTLPAGKISLIVGPSGVGKTVLLKIIAGLIPPADQGIRYEGQIRVGEGLRRMGEIGIVFQNFALFDELTPRANLRLAKDLGGARSRPIQVAAMLSDLRVPHQVPTSQLSGGQRQRLAIARTLAFNPPAILYDEPTSGLDPATGSKVAELIRATHERYGKTSVIVTHDYETLLPIADELLLLDPIAKTLRRVPREDWSRLNELLQPMAAAAVREIEPQPRSLRERAIAGLLEFLRGTGRAVEAAAEGLVALVPLWRNPHWGLRYVAHYLRLVMGPTAWFYLAIAGIITGFVTTYFIFRYLPYSAYIEPLLIDDLLSAMGFTMYRIFVPVLATVLIAARCGAAVSSDVGSKQYGQQVDALQSIGAAPRYYLLTPIVWSFVVGTPVLTLLAFFSAELTSMLVFVSTHSDHGPDFWNLNFHYGLTRDVSSWFYKGTGWLIGKLVACGFGVATIAYFRARRPKYSSTDVSDSVTATIFWSTLFVLVVHFLFAFWEFDPADVSR